MRTFHIGGTASGLAEQSFFIAKHDGIVEWRGIRTVTNRDGKHVVMSRKAQIVIVSQDGVNCNVMILNMVQLFLLKMSKKLKLVQNLLNGIQQ